MALGKEEILEALKQIYDPEIPVDIVNLGLVYEVRVERELVYVKITTTAPGCPVGNFIAGEIKQVIRDLAEVDLTVNGEQIPDVVVRQPTIHRGRCTE